MEKLILPDHVVKISDKWYKNNKTQKFIHADKIQAFCDRFWEVADQIRLNGYAKGQNNHNIKQAKKRWDL